MNKVLQTDVSERNKAFEIMMSELKPSKDVAKNMDWSFFLQGRLVVWNNKKPVYRHTEGKAGFLTCDVCGTDHRFVKQMRALRHVTSKSHHTAAKKQLAADSTTHSQNLMNDQVHTFASKLGY